MLVWYQDTVIVDLQPSMQSDRGNQSICWLCHDRLTQTYLTQTYLCAQPHLVPGADPGRARYVHAGLEVGADRLLLSERAAIICCAVW